MTDTRTLPKATTEQVGIEAPARSEEWQAGFLAGLAAAAADTEHMASLYGRDGMPETADMLRGRAACIRILEIPTIGDRVA